MVLAEIGGAAGADAVFLDAHAINVEAAHDRPAGRAGREARSGDAGLGEQQIAKRAARGALHLVAGHHRHGRELIGDDRQPAGRFGRRLGGRGGGKGRGNGRGWCSGGGPACPDDRARGADHDLRELGRGLRLGVCGAFPRSG